MNEPISVGYLSESEIAQEERQVDSLEVDSKPDTKIMFVLYCPLA